VGYNPLLQCLSVVVTVVAKSGSPAACILGRHRDAARRWRIQSTVVARADEGGHGVAIRLPSLTHRSSVCFELSLRRYEEKGERGKWVLGLMMGIGVLVLFTWDLRATVYSRMDGWR
jgi:hypothetical protein